MPLTKILHHVFLRPPLFFRAATAKSGQSNLAEGDIVMYKASNILSTFLRQGFNIFLGDIASEYRIMSPIATVFSVAWSVGRSVGPKPCIVPKRLNVSR